MFRLFVLKISLLIIGFPIRNAKTTSTAIPDILYDCYRNNFTAGAKPPLTLTLLLELIRKIELDQQNALDARMLSTSMLHSIILDGIRRSQATEDFAIPYRAAGKEFDRYSLIVDYLIPGQSLQFPTNSLTKTELCFLHKLISNSVDPSQRGDEAETCKQKTNMPFKQEFQDDTSACPLAEGNIRTKWGPVSAGHIISGIASVLEKPTVTFARIQDSIGRRKNITNLRKFLIKDKLNVDSLWVSTVAADLAESILNQANEDIVIGNEGFWNDIILPRSYYLNSQSTWDFYDAEVMGSIDAINIATNVNSIPTSGTRLSQLIDMYYSDFMTEYAVSNRSQIFNKALQKVNLLEQVIGSAKLLQECTAFDVLLLEEDIMKLSTIAVDKYKHVAGNLSKFYETADILPRKRLNTALEIIAVIDETWDKNTAEKLLYDLAETTQVSTYGSRLGVINAQTGGWISNVTSEVFELFEGFHANRNSWPKSSVINRGLENVIRYYQNKTYTDCTSLKLTPRGRALIILAPSARLTTKDLQDSQEAIQSIKGVFPETNIIYVASSENHDMYNDLIRSSNGNDTVIYNVNDINTLVTQLTDKLSQIPASIVNTYCNERQKRLEDYITPNIETFYEIHAEYTRRADVEVKFKGNDYGNVSICVLIPEANNKKECYSIIGNEVGFNSKNYCSEDSQCFLQFKITAANSQFKCLENDCRYPNQVRIDIISTTSSGTMCALGTTVFLIHFLLQLLYTF